MKLHLLQPISVAAILTVMSLGASQAQAHDHCPPHHVRVWCPPVYETVCRQVWCEPVYRQQAYVAYDHCGHAVTAYRTVLVRAGHYDTVHQRVLVRAGHWTFQRR